MTGIIRVDIDNLDLPKGLSKEQKCMKTKTQRHDETSSFNMNELKHPLLHCQHHYLNSFQAKLTTDSIYIENEHFEIMELPFAVENAPASTYLPTSSPTYQNVSSLHKSSSSQHSHSSATRTSLTSSNGQHRGEPVNLGSQTTAATTNLLHRVALYDNVHPDFYTPQNIPLPTSHQHHALKSHMHTHQNQHQHRHHQQHHESIEEDDFVTIDADDNITVQTTSSSTSYHYPPPTTVVPPSRSSKHHSLSVSKTNVAYGNQTDVLALLLSSVTAPSPLGLVEGKAHDEEDPSNGHVSYQQGSNPMMNFCQRAAESASSAARATRDGHIDQAVKYHLEASRCYRDAALLLKREHKVGGESAASTWGVDVKILAYSLLMSSNSQARNADCLIKSGNVNLGEIVKNIGGKEGTGGSNDTGGRSGGNEGKQTSGKENRLRAKIRASMDTAEADMTDSTFLGKANGHPQPATVQIPQEGNAAGSNAQEKVQPSTDSSAVVDLKKTPNSVNPVDDMMALEQELRNMDATLNMGVNLSSSTSSISTKKTMEDGSFCVVPGSGASTGGSSFVSSSMMWGGRNAHTNGHAHGNGRARANRVQTILGASSAGMHKSPSVGNHQQLHQPHHFTNNIQNTKHHPGLESSWWGQASALASSTTSLSNSMVGVRSANIGSNHMHSNGAGASPTNTKQLMRLLDSLKTLGDENTSLLKEVDDAKKARIEVKAAREAMKTFQEEYNHKFNHLRAALSEFRAMYPDQKGRPGNNIVSKSNYVKASTAEKKASAELQKRDQTIQKLNADLMAEKAESKKKDDSLRKYESFYKEVKARSEQKKRQQQEEERRRRN